MNSDIDITGSKRSNFRKSKKGRKTGLENYESRDDLLEGVRDSESIRKNRSEEICEIN